jgi:hypothetical protein
MNLSSVRQLIVGLLARLRYFLSTPQSTTPPQSSKPRSNAKVTGVKLVGGTDLERNRRMEHGCNGRHEFGSEIASA